MSTSKGKPITLDEIIENEGNVYPIEVPGIGLIKVRRPTIGDRKIARREVLSLPDYEKLDEILKEEEFQTRIILKIIVEPVIKPEDLEKVNSDKLLAIIDVVSGWLAVQSKKLSSERKNMMDDFLSQMKGNSPSSSSTS